MSLKHFALALAAILIASVVLSGQARGGMGYWRNAVNTSAPTGTLITQDPQTVANGAVMSIGTNAVAGFVLVQSLEDNTIGMFNVRGTANATNELQDPQAIFSTTALTATSINVYWSAANSRYEVENTRGGSRTIRVIRLGL